MIERWIQWHLFLVRHRLAVLAGFILLLGLAALGSRHLKLNEDFTDILPMSAPAIAEQVEALRHIRQAERLYIDVATTTTNRAELAELAEAAARMTAALREVPHLGDLRGEVNVADMGQAYAELQAQLPVMMTARELQGVESRLTVEALEKRLAWLKQAMTQPQGMMFKNVAQTDPAGLGDIVSSRLRALQAGAGDARLVDGRITSADGCHVLINATPDFPSSNTGKSAALVPAVLAAARAVEQQFPAGAIRIAVTGAHRSALDNTVSIRADTTRTSIIATVAIAGLIILACRRRLLALMALIPVAFGALGGVAIFYFTGDRVSAVALGCGSMLIGVTVDYGIYLLYTLDDQPPANRRELARTVGELVPALAFGALTTMAAFFVMLLSPISGHRQLGLFGAVGVGLAALFTLFILPVFIPVQTPRRFTPLPLTALLQRVFAWRNRHTRFMLAVLGVLAVISLVGLARLKFDGDLARLNGESQATMADEQVIRQNWGRALSMTTIVVSGASREETLVKNEQVFGVLEKLRVNGGCDSFSSLAPLQPSAQTRQANAVAWQQFWTAERQTQLRAALAQAAGRLGFRLEAFAPFFDRLAAAPAESAVPEAAALKRLTADFWSEQDGRFYVTTLVKVEGGEKFHALRTAVQSVVPDARMLNRSVLSEEITRVARHALPLFGVLVLALNAFLIFLLLGRWELVLVTLLPMLVGVLFTLGTLGLCGLPIDVANFVFVIFIVGVGGDYSLFMVLSELEPVRGRPERTASTGGAVTMCAMTSLLGAGVLVLAHHPALFSVGLTALLGISFTLLVTLFLVPVSVRWLAQQKTALPDLGVATPRQTLRAVTRLYHFQGPYVAQFAYWKMRTDPLFQAVDREIPESAEIFDAGCGYGLVAHWLTAFHPARRVHGVDFDPDKIRVAQMTAAANPRVRFESRDLLEWTEYPACDRALLCDVLHYFPNEQKAAVLRKIHAALRPGGWLVVREAMAREDAAHQAVARSEKWGVWLGQNRTRHGLHFADQATYEMLLREAGFTEIKIRTGSGLGSNTLLLAMKPAA